MDDKLSAQVCAATLQYGLFEQGRLFGIPDVIAPFVVDNRVDRGLHFIGQVDLRRDVRQPHEEGGDILADPKSKLEMYIAYRLSSTSIWAILVANVAGYMMVRALAPTACTPEVCRDRTNVQQAHARGEPANTSPSCWCGHRLGWPLYLAQFVNLLVIYWIFLASTPRRSRTTTSRPSATTGRVGRAGAVGRLRHHVGQARFARFGEHLIGILLVFTFLFVLFQMVIGRSMVDPLLVEEGSQAGRNGSAWTRWR